MGKEFSAIDIKAVTTVISQMKTTVGLSLMSSRTITESEAQYVCKVFPTLTHSDPAAGSIKQNFALDLVSSGVSTCPSTFKSELTGIQPS